MQTPLQVLQPLAADHDGDALNIMLILNRMFFQRCYEIFNPRNAMYISRNDGNINASVLVQRDTIINANTMLHMGRVHYTDEQLAKIMAVKQRQKELHNIGY